jgi:hypothetical protein
VREERESIDTLLVEGGEGEDEILREFARSFFGRERREQARFGRERREYYQFERERALLHCGGVISTLPPLIHTTKVS